MQIVAIILIVLGTAGIVVMFVRSRVGAGEPVLKLTEQDRVELREFRREFAPRRIVAGLLGLFAGVCFVGGVMSLLHLDASGQTDRTIAVVMIVLSQVLVLCVWVLVRKKQ